MERNFLIEQITKVIKVETEFSVFEESAVKLQQTENKSLINLKTEEQSLRTQLENLKKKNFSLKAIIQAWKTTYEQKQKDLAEAESKLNKIYDEIWSEREEFCARAEKFSDKYGILSKWWRERINETFSPVVKANEKHKEKIDKLENRTEEEQEAEVLEKEDKSFGVLDVECQQAESFVLNRNEVPKECSPELENGSKNASPDRTHETIKSPKLLNEHEANEFNEGLKKLEPLERQMNIKTWDSTRPENGTEIPKKKKVRFSKENEKITIFYENPGTLKMKFFSMVDTETVRKANKVRNKRKNQLLGQATNSRNKVL